MQLIFERFNLERDNFDLVLLLSKWLFQRVWVLVDKTLTKMAKQNMIEFSCLLAETVS